MKKLLFILKKIFFTTNLFLTTDTYIHTHIHTYTYKPHFCILPSFLDSRSIKYDYSFKLSPINIKRRAASRILLKNCLKLYDSCGSGDGHDEHIFCDLRKVENRITNYLNNYVGGESGGMVNNNNNDNNNNNNQ